MPDLLLERQAFGTIGTSYRGEIWENAASFRLIGKAYESMPKEQDGHFRITTARHLEGPLRALNDPEVRTVIIIGATQVMKSVAGDIWIPFIMEHDPSNALVLFEDDPKAKLFCEVRLMPTIKKHPTLKARIASEITDRHDATKTKIITPTMSLVAGGLNDGNVSSLSWRYVWVSEAWQHKADGLLRKAIKRADRFPDTCKILIESQAGMADEDLHTEAMGAHQVKLTWACPHCGGRQTWEFSQKREDGTFAGMDFLPAEDGNRLRSIEERARSARWECLHCREKIDDTVANRQAIMDSYEQDYRVKGEDGSLISPRAVCFYLPKESARNNSFEESARSYLNAKAQVEQGNEIPLENWYMAERAVFYTPKLTQTRAPVVTGTYDPTVDKIPDEKFRCLSVDAQKDLELSDRLGKEVTGHFWFIASAIDRSGNIFQLARGYATSWQELIAVQKQFKIPNRNFCIDTRHWGDLIREQAAKHRTVEKSLEGSGRNVFATWRCFMGDDSRGYRWPDNVFRIYKMPRTDLIDVRDDAGKWLKVAVSTTLWSNFSATNQLKALQRGDAGKPKLLALPDNSAHLSDLTRAKEVGDFTYENQTQGQILGLERNKPKWIDLHKQQHYADCLKQTLVLCAMAGLIGHVAAPEEAAQET